MGFLNQNKGGKGNGVYLEIAETAKSARPLNKEPTPIWIHTIPEVRTTGPTGQPVVLRKFSTEACTSSSKSGAGCQCCTTQDPLWDLLDAKTKVNKKGQRADFPKKCIHLLPVFDHSAASVKVMKGGNQLFETMDGWYGEQQEQDPSLADLRRCDWKVLKSGKGLMTKYSVIRQDATTFNLTPDMVHDAMLALQQAVQDLQPVPPEVFQKVIHGEDPNAPVQQNAGLAQFAVGAVTGASAGSVVLQGVPSVGTSGVTGTVSPVMRGVLPDLGLQNSMSNALPPQPVVVSAPPVQPTIPTQPVSNASVLTEFTAWINTQPEFLGMGIVKNLMPAIKEKIGSTDYHLCSPDQLVALRSALSLKLNSLRNRS